jgi:hypothetical protein
MDRCLSRGRREARADGRLVDLSGGAEHASGDTRAGPLGTTLTTRHTGYAKEVDAIFGLPSGVHSYAILPIGWPMGRFGPLGRGPLKDVVYQDQWGKPYRGL